MLLRKSSLMPVYLTGRNPLLYGALGSGGTARVEVWKSPLTSLPKTP